jgi:hypothetical protein
MVWRLGSILGLLPAPSPPYLYQGRQLARIKAQHRIRQGLHEPRFNERRHRYGKQDRKDCSGFDSIKSSDQWKHGSYQSIVKNFGIKSFSNHSDKSQQRLKHRNHKEGNYRRAAELPQTCSNSKRTYRADIRQS